MSKPASPYQPIPATLEKVTQETSNIKTFWLRPAQPIPFRTGQFVELTVPGLGEAPFTPSSSPAVADKMEVTIMKAGAVTERLHSLEAGAQLGVRGPYGKGYPMEEFYGKELLILGGGVGLAPLRSLLYQVFEDMDKFPRVILLYGAKSPADLVYAGQLQEWAKRDKKFEVLHTDKPIIVYISFQPYPRHVQIMNLGKIEDNETVAFMTNFPIMYPGDMVVEPSERHWRVVNVEVTERKRVVVHQLIRLRQLDHNDVEYEVLRHLDNQGV